MADTLTVKQNILEDQRVTGFLAMVQLEGSNILDIQAPNER